MRFDYILIVTAIACGYAKAIRSQDASVGQYIDLVNIYFKYKHVSVLTEFTCFSNGKLESQFFLYILGANWQQ